jgi:hypothetical protein
MTRESPLLRLAHEDHHHLVELAGPMLRRLGIMHGQILLDPHGDSDIRRESATSENVDET